MIMTTPRYTIEEVIRVLEFYNKQGCTIENVIEILECDLEYIQNQSDTIPESP